MHNIHVDLDRIYVNPAFTFRCLVAKSLLCITSLLHIFLSLSLSLSLTHTHALSPPPLPLAPPSPSSLSLSPHLRLQKKNAHLQETLAMVEQDHQLAINKMQQTHDDRIAKMREHYVDFTHSILTLKDSTPSSGQGQAGGGGASGSGSGTSKSK